MRRERWRPLTVELKKKSGRGLSPALCGGLLGDLAAPFRGELVCPSLSPCGGALALGDGSGAVVRRGWGELPRSFPDDLLIDLECGLNGIAGAFWVGWHGSMVTRGDPGMGPPLEA